MDQTLSIAILVGFVVASPWLLLFFYRATIPPGMLWAAILCQFFLPIIGWAIALYVALRDWDFPPPPDS
ncbi:MAG: hypothetical protein H6R10_2047 [Rhodocyclaceae bacterium]|nr:hypothetical protein [Rhodocyclaceae bacterium]